MPLRRPALVASALVAVVSCWMLSAAGAEEKFKCAGPLADYVGKVDDSYGWKKRRETKLGETTLVELTLTSQTWRGIPWKHQLFLYKPKEIRTPANALLYISGGSWSDELEKPAEGQAGLPSEAQLLALVAEKLGAPVALLRHVPQQPIFDGKREDAIIAHTFMQFYLTGQSEWPLLLPMVKSAVRGMDAAQEYAARQWDLKLEQFTVTGASKRGWTTWLTGALDRRAVAIAPMVIDTLNFVPQMKHQVETFGAFSEQIKDYTLLGMQKLLDTPRGQQLCAIVDPYCYCKSLQQPKLLMIGTNDRYWPLDALNLYWNDLGGDKYVLYVPNNGHGLRDIARVVGGVNALHQAAAGRLVLPKLTWQLDEADNGLRAQVTADVKPVRVVAWMATSPTRDFRDAKWTSQPTTTVADEAAGGEKKPASHQFTLARPKSGYAALFLESVFEVDGTPYFLSTNVKIVGVKAGK